MNEENITNKQPLIRHVNRQQLSWRAMDVEKLISEDHPARAIWTLVGRLDLSSFYRAIDSSAEEGGRPAFDPQLLISLWVYAYSQGIGSAREVARRCEYDPAFQWLTGLTEVNYHTLADFRVEKQQELDELFTQVLAALSKEGLITLEQVMQDGTKIKALASSRSFRQEETIREHLEQARQRVATMGDPRNDESSPKAKQAQARARREQQERLERALEELQKLQVRKDGRKPKRGPGVSTTDPQARVMKQSEEGFALSYNAQISADAAHGLIVGVAVTQAANDTGQLLPAVDQVEQRLNKRPQQMVADRGYTTRENIEEMTRREIDFLGAMRYVPRGANLPNRFPPNAFPYEPERDCCVCPEGKILQRQRQRKAGPGMIYHVFEARVEDCQACSRKLECCPDNKIHGRSVAHLEESPLVIAFRKKMASEEAPKYRRRGRIVEFCHAWIKSKLGLRQFHVRGLAKAQMEMLWACLPYNLQHWIRLSKLRAIPAVT
jgi:transposase